MAVSPVRDSTCCSTGPTFSAKTSHGSSRTGQRFTLYRQAVTGDATGRVLGLVLHPERHVELRHHSEWTRRTDRRDGDGLRLFRNLVEQARRGD